VPHSRFLGNNSLYHHHLSSEYEAEEAREKGEIFHRIFTDIYSSHRSPPVSEHNSATKMFTSNQFGSKNPPLLRGEGLLRGTTLLASFHKDEARKKAALVALTGDSRHQLSFP
jgi:hypothetical protein